MQIQLNVPDVYRAAVLLEKRAVTFYQEAAKRADRSAVSLLQQLAEMEKGHVEHFERLLYALPKLTGEHETAFMGKSPESMYLNAMADDRIITQATEIQPHDGIEEIYLKAMAIEKNAVAFYTAVKTIVSGQLPQNQMDAMISEEIAHFTMLNQALAVWRSTYKQL